jgi:hypothetical protein
MPVATRIALLLTAISLAALGMHVIGRGTEAGSIMVQACGGGLACVAVACLYVAEVEPKKRLLTYFREIKGHRRNRGLE